MTDRIGVLLCTTYSNFRCGGSDYYFICYVQFSLRNIYFYPTMSPRVRSLYLQYFSLGTSHYFRAHLNPDFLKSVVGRYFVYDCKLATDLALGTENPYAPWVDICCTELLSVYFMIFCTSVSSTVSSFSDKLHGNHRYRKEIPELLYCSM